MGCLILNVLKTGLQILKNRYFLTSLVFLLWMLFLDKDDLFTQINLDRKLNDVESQKEYYQKEIQKLKTDLVDLKSRPEKLEKLAREKYYMKKDNEDVYVLITEKKTKQKDSFFNKIRSIFSKPTPN